MRVTCCVLNGILSFADKIYLSQDYPGRCSQRYFKGVLYKTKAPPKRGSVNQLSVTDSAKSVSSYLFTDRQRLPGGSLRESI